MFICCLLGLQMHLKSPWALLLQLFPLVSSMPFHWLQPRNCCHDLQPSSCGGKDQSGSLITCLKYPRGFSIRGGHGMAPEGWWDPSAGGWHSACSAHPFLERLFNPEKIQVRSYVHFESWQKVFATGRTRRYGSAWRSPKAGGRSELQPLGWESPL